MLDENLMQIALEADPEPAHRQTTAGEAVSESVRAMWAKTNLMTLRHGEQAIFDEAREDYIRVTGKPPAPIPQQTEEFITADKRALPLTEKNWFLDQIARLPPEQRAQIPTAEELDRRFLAARDAQIREASARVAAASPFAQIVGTLVGGAIAGITDPFTLLLLPFGGFARPGLSAGAAMLRVGATEALIGGVSAIPGELLNATMEERSGRKASLESAVANVGLAALGGFAFGGLLEGGIRIGRRLHNNYRVRKLDAEVRVLRDIERQADDIAVAMRRAGVDFQAPAQRKAAEAALNEAIIKVKNNEVLEALAFVTTAERQLGGTPTDFVRTVREIYDIPETQRLLREAEKAGQEAKQASAKTQQREADGVAEQATPTTPGAEPSKPAIRPETAATHRAFEKKSPTARFRELNRELPDSVKVVRDKTAKSGYAVKVTRAGEPPQNVPIKDPNSERSVAYALRAARAFDLPEPSRTVVGATVEKFATPPSLAARDAEKAVYHAIEVEDFVAAAQKRVERSVEGRETEKVFFDMDAEGNMITRSLEDLRAADAEDDFLANEFKGCMTGGR